jgi:hypothetical protein
VVALGVVDAVGDRTGVATAVVVETGEPVGVRVRVGVTSEVGVDDGDPVTVGVAEVDGDGVDVGVRVAVGVLVAVGPDVLVGETVGVRVAVADGVDVGVLEGVGVTVAPVDEITIVSKAPLRTEPRIVMKVATSVVRLTEAFPFSSVVAVDALNVPAEVVKFTTVPGTGVLWTLVTRAVIVAGSIPSGSIEPVSEVRVTSVGFDVYELPGSIPPGM